MVKTTARLFTLNLGAEVSLWVSGRRPTATSPDFVHFN